MGRAVELRVFRRSTGHGSGDAVECWPVESARLSAYEDQLISCDVTTDSRVAGRVPTNCCGFGTALFGNREAALMTRFDFLFRRVCRPH
jgi:hypothetical protein